MGTLGDRLTRIDATDLITKISIIVEENERYFINSSVAGSYRRGLDDLGDIDIIVITNDSSFSDELINYFKESEEFEVRSSGSKKITILDKNNHQVDLYSACLSNFGAMLLFLTGSAKLNIRMRNVAKKLGYKLSQYGLYGGDGYGDVIACRNEEDIFEALKMKFLEPKDRSE